ncbi:MAG: anti-sigma factor family protein [Pyrinomonadaceae bacterium]
MTEKCFDIGTIQAFLDGELNEDLLEQAARHFSVCAVCARLLAEAESESAFAFAALETELNALVPTTRIRANLYEAIAAEKKSFWKKIFGSDFRFSNSTIAAFASLTLIVGLFATLFIVREKRGASVETAKIETQKSVETRKIITQVEPVSAHPESVKKSPISTVPPQILKAQTKPIIGNRATIQNADDKMRRTLIKNRTPETANKTADVGARQPAKNEGLIGEESYLKTIATLSETVNGRKDEVLKPSARVSFEKGLAVVNDSIAKMQKEVRRHPKNEAAKELLRASYQNKIDLLNSVADQTELMATLR